MTSTKTLPQPAASASRRNGVAQRRWHQAAALLLTALGALLLMGNLGLLRADARQAVDIAWAVVLLAAGVLLAATRGRPTVLPLEKFAVERGQAERAVLTATTGTADLQVRVLQDAHL